jgi:myo-inositol-1(or 4)-monophosphatase
MPDPVTLAWTGEAADGAAQDSAFGDDVGFAVELARRAGGVLMDRYERLERIDYKSARDVVTEADHLSEGLIIEAIRERYPDDAILAEETGEHHAVAGEAPTSGRGRVWIVDPLDGTVNYANGIPMFCVSIALVVDARPAVGVILDPTRNELFTATSDGPAFLDGRPVRASVKESLSDFVISMALSGRSAVTRTRNVRKAIRIPRSMGSAALALAYVANGRFDAFIQQGGLSTWDVAAAGLIAERGGATVTAMDGGPWFDVARGPRTIGMLAAPPVHHPALLALVRTEPPRSAGRSSRSAGTVRA